MSFDLLAQQIWFLSTSGFQNLFKALHIFKQHKNKTSLAPIPPQSPIKPEKRIPPATWVVRAGALNGPRSPLRLPSRPTHAWQATCVQPCGRDALYKIYVFAMGFQQPSFQSSLPNNHCFYYISVPVLLLVLEGYRVTKVQFRTPYPFFSLKVSHFGPCLSAKCKTTSRHLSPSACFWSVRPWDCPAPP